MAAARAWRASTKELLKGVPRPLGTLVTVVLAIAGSVGAVASFVTEHWAWGLAIFLGMVAVALFLAGVDVVRRVSVLEERLTPILRLPNAASWAWFIIPGGGPLLTPTRFTKITAVPVTNESEATVENCEGQIAVVTPYMPEVPVPYQLHWMKGETALVEMCRIPPTSTRNLVLPKALATGHRSAELEVTLEVWSDKTAKERRRYRAIPRAINGEVWVDLKELPDA